MTIVFPALTPIEDATRREFLTGASAAVLAAALAACATGAGGDPDDDTVTVEDYFGPVQVPSDPQRVISNDSQTMATMITLGVNPIASYFYGNQDYLGDAVNKVKDISNQADGTADMEQALALDPDLVITIVGTHGEAFLAEEYETYQRVVPTFGWMRDYRSIDGLEENIVAVGRALNREDQARELFAGVRSRVDEFRSRVDKLAAAPRVNLVRVTSTQGVRVRFQEAVPALVSGIGLQFGLPQVEGEFGNVDVSPENLQVLDDADVLFLLVDSDAGDEWTKLGADPLWQGVRAVKDGRAYQVDLDPWLQTDVTAIHLILDDIERFVIERAESR